ncbi:MAG: DUF554 domain-containing protein [Candidatus Izemoplasmataceae bacterium]
MGTLINTAAIIVASLIGLVFKKGLPKPYQNVIMFTLGLALTVISIGWFLQDFLVVEDGGLSTRYDLLVMVSLILGSLIGEVIDIDGWLNRVAYGVEKKYNLPPLAKGFISATLIFCVGALAIVGSIQDGLYGDSTTLIFKSTLDFITAIMLTTVFGIGVMFSAISVLIYQGSITLLAMASANFLSDPMIVSMTMVGNIILVAMGLNFMEIKKIKVANMLPALVLPILYFVIIGLF